VGRPDFEAALSGSVMYAGGLARVEMAKAETVKKQIKVLVVGINHNIQRHQDIVPELEKVRADFERFLREIIEKDEIDLVAEEAGDDTTVWKKLILLDVLQEIVDSPASPIAKTIADKYGVRHEDVDVDVRVVDKNDLESIKKRSDAMTEKILKVLGAADRVLVIVGELHRPDVVQRLEEKDMSVECMHFPE
jgi:hypothetical protein